MRRSHSRLTARFILCLAVPALAGSMVLALVNRPPEALDERVRPPRLFLEVPQPVPEGASGPGAAPAAALRSRFPGRWEVMFDRRTGRPSLIAGRGIPFLPGSGNTLSAATLALPAVPRDVAEAEPLARAFIDAQAEMLRPPAGELRLNPERSGAFDEGRLWFFDFDWYVDDVPVEGARVYLRVNHGNLIQFGSARIGPGALTTAPILDASDALDRVFAHAGGRSGADRVIEPGRLLILPLPRGGSTTPWAAGVEYRLVWRSAFRRGAAHPTWTAEVDAHTGEVLSFYDANRYARVTGGIHPRTVSDPEQEYPFTHVRVTHAGASIDTGEAGTYSYAGGAAFTALDGPHFRTVCIGCSGPERAFAFTDEGTGDLSLGTGGVDEVGNGVSTAAERNSFFHLNRVRALALKWLSLSWLNTTVVANVNVDDVCNAYWNGSVNFFRSGSGCNNTGEIADVMYHEWGHGLDQYTNLGDGSAGEATGDITSMHLTHDAMVGPSFTVNGDPVRDLDASRVGYVARTDNLDTFCIVCQPGQCSNGPYGHEVHCEGEIYGQAQWDLAGLLTAKHGFNTGWQTLERIYFLSLPQVDNFRPGVSGNAYDAYLAVDDDNGNLSDGTPNCLEIFGAFNAHGIAGSSCGASSAGCVRPPEPVITPSAAPGRVVLDWTASAGAATYRVLRSEFASTGAYFPLATTGGTHFEDATVQPGVTYDYVVEAETAAGCRSTIEGSVAASAAAEARLDLGAPLLDDTPAGNRSGFADPVESIDLTLPLTNVRPADAAAAAHGTLSSGTPGVTVTTTAASYGSIAPGATSSGSAYRAALDSGLACGASASFVLDMADGGAAPSTQAYFPVLVGERVTRFFDDFSADTGWSPGLGFPNTSIGAWERGDPNGTSWQPELDADGDPESSSCYFTGQTQNVGSGETVLLSPLIDLGGAAAARLSYRRWWASSSLTDTGDSFAVDVSDDGGSSWVNVETVGAAERALGWQPVEARLESLVSLNSQFRIRVRAEDGASGTTVEAAIDNVRVEEVVCDLTPPCFIEPSFAGLASITPGPSCAELDLAWSPAASNCLNAQITYSVYRSTLPGFSPGPANRIAQDLPGTAFHDTLLAPGTVYFYVVRAFDSRSGEDSNLVELSLAAPGGADTVAPVFSGLASAAPGDGCGETVLTWLPAGESCSAPVRYDVHRSTTPGFTPGPATLVASTLSAGYIDTALVPTQSYAYLVRAVDSAGNGDGNLEERTTAARVLPLEIYQQSFESSNGGWGTIAPNDAVTGRWEWGDPEGTGVQPEDDHTPDPGVNGWITGLAGLGGIGGNDIDGGTTTLSSPDIDVTAASAAPVLEMALFFSNDAGDNPGEDPLWIDVSDNGGSTWTPVLNTTTGIPAWTVQQFPLTGAITPTSQFRIRITASDLGAGGSVVEGGVDDVRVFQPGAGCSGCALPVDEVGTILVSRVGDDIVIDWSADPVTAAAYNVYLLSGPGLSQAVRAGSTSSKSFVHLGAALLTGQNFTYRVTAVDACAQESSP